MPRVNGVSFHDDPSIESFCRTVRDTGFDSLELSRAPFYNKLTTRGTREWFSEWAASLGLSLHGFDCWVNVSPYKKFDATISSFEAAIEFTDHMNLGMIISHDPWGEDNGDRSPTECMTVNVDLFRRVADMCAAKGIRLIFEPHPDTLTMDNQWAIEFIDRVAEDHSPEPGRLCNVGFLYDCCHYGLGQPDTYVDSIATLGHRIGHFHVCDGDKETYALHLPLGDGKIDIDGTVRELKLIGYNGPITNDLFTYPLPEEGARRNVDRVREIERELGLA